MRIARALHVAAVTAIACIACLSAFAQATGSEPRLVMKGFDPVAYFTQGKPVVGSARFSHDWDGGRYQFASAGNRDLFAGDPDRYAPRYSGYCTGSMSRGVRNEGDPEIWTIVDGKLFLFGSGKGREVGLAARERLRADPAGVQALAQKNWESLRR